MRGLVLAPVLGATRYWVRVYTAGLAPDVREARRAELESDLWEQEHEAAAAGRRPAGTAVQVLRRLLLGVPADLHWRRQRGGAKALRRAVHVAGARLSTAAIGRTWLLAALVLSLGAAFSIGFVGRADGGVQRSGSDSCWFQSADDEPAPKAGARDK